MKSSWIGMAMVVMMSGSWASLRIPFSGSLGATSGAGSLLGWETFGQGLNPAAGEGKAIGLSLSTYAPFGMDELRISEAGLAAFGSRWGAAIDYRGWEGLEGYSSAIEVRESLALNRNFRIGVFTGWRDTDGKSGMQGVGAGILWSPLSFLRVGATASGKPDPDHVPLLGMGADAGFIFKRDYAIRTCVENHFRPDGTVHWRFGARLRLHSQLSMHAGFSPTVETVGLGLQFGMGGWEGFHALRLHPVLGSTSVQSLRWRRHFGNLRP